MKLNRVFLVTALVGILSCASVFAQHQGGISGPDNSTYPNTNPFQTSSTVPTHASVKAAMGDCLNTEMLRIMRALAKTNQIEQIFNSPILGASGLTNLDPGRSSGDLGNTQFIAAYGKTPGSAVNCGPYGEVCASVTLSQQGRGNGPFIYEAATYFNFVGAPIPELHFGIKNGNDFPVLKWEETPLADAFDEYGRVNYEKVIASNIRWVVDAGLTLLSATPANLAKTFPLYNKDQNTQINGQYSVIQGVEFDMPSYSSCVNAKLGIHP
jgi:hypothetical protein